MSETSHTINVDDVCTNEYKTKYLLPKSCAINAPKEEGIFCLLSCVGGWREIIGYTVGGDAIYETDGGHKAIVGYTCDGEPIYGSSSLDVAGRSGDLGVSNGSILPGDNVVNAGGSPAIKPCVRGINAGPYGSDGYKPVYLGLPSFGYIGPTGEFVPYSDSSVGEYMITARSNMSIDGESKSTRGGGTKVIEGGYEGRLTRSRSGRSVGSKRTAKDSNAVGSTNVEDIDPML